MKFNIKILIPIKFVLSLILVMSSFASLATHNRGGAITYVHRPDLGFYTYEFLIQTCTKESAPADRDVLYIDWGDSSPNDTVPRVNGNGSPQGNDAQLNNYPIIHTFQGPGTFRVTVEDPNRNGGIINLGGSVSSDQIPFCIATEIIISPFLGFNNSVQFQDPLCPAIACNNFMYCFNLQGVDPDGDSLSYRLVPCLGENCLALNIPNLYQYPDNYGGIISIDQNGTICWDAPSMIGEYNIAVLVEEWRNGFKIGSVLRDIQIIVEANCNNNPPEVTTIDDTCIYAGDTLIFDVHAYDTVDSDSLRLSVNSNFSNSFQIAYGRDSVDGTFYWVTDCNDIQMGTYTAYFSAIDDGFPELSGYKSVNIRVLPPSPQNLNASILANEVDLTWDIPSCTNYSSFRIYRYNGSFNDTILCCDFGTPSNNGFEFLGEVSDQVTSYIDLTELVVGKEYCYVVTAVYSGGIESCISNLSCIVPKRDVPIITNVSIGVTDVSIGEDTIKWTKPYELDTLQIQPPYFYSIDFATNPSSNFNTVFKSSVFNSFEEIDTVFIHQNINTSIGPLYYRVRLFNIQGVDSIQIGSSSVASSLLLSAQPNDNRVDLSWQSFTPWDNLTYYIFKGNAIGGTFNLIDSTSNTFYSDSGLVNGVMYCYKIVSKGEYGANDIVKPLINSSQEICASPVDLTPPCAPFLTIEKDCDQVNNKLIWTNPNNSCADDVTRYKIYYKPSDTSEYRLIDSIDILQDTIYNHSDRGSIAGCYYVTALDSIIYNNESEPSNEVCIDNCPIYFLPNVFSPNGDGKNDYFIPLSPYRYIDSIHMSIFNRWGQLVYEATDPNINWDGKDYISGKDVSEGVYFYECVVFGRRLFGLDVTNLSGEIHILRTEKTE